MILPQQMTQKELAEQWKQGVQIMYRNQTKEVKIGDVVIGGDHPIAIQSMTNTKTEDVAATVAQIKQLTKVGCEIIRCTVPTLEAAKAISEIRKQISIRIVQFQFYKMNRRQIRRFLFLAIQFKFIE